MTSAPAGASRGIEAFTGAEDRRIYVVTSTSLFRRLQTRTDRCGDLEAVRKLASVLVHEEAHIVRGAGKWRPTPSS